MSQLVGSQIGATCCRWQTWPWRTAAAEIDNSSQGLVLQLLDSREMYGYQLARSIRVLTIDAVAIGESVLYPGACIACAQLAMRCLIVSETRLTASVSSVSTATTRSCSVVSKSDFSRNCVSRTDRSASDASLRRA